MRRSAHLSTKWGVLGFVLITTGMALNSIQEPHDMILSGSVIPSVEVLNTLQDDVMVSLPPIQGPPDYIPPLTLTLRATGYNSLESQTDSTPFITAIGTRTRFGIIAASRDLINDELPYGSVVRLRDLGQYGNGLGKGAYNHLLAGQEFIVEDTMHLRKRQQVDIWFPTYREAAQWGVRQVELELVRYSEDKHHARYLRSYRNPDTQPSSFSADFTSSDSAGSIGN